MAQCNLVSMYFNQFVKVVELRIKAAKDGVEEQLPILGLGAPGIGKTSVLAALARQYGIGYKTIRLASLDRTDLTGMPSNVKDENGVLRTVYGTNSLLPTIEKDGEIGILVFDELFAAPADVQTVVSQLLDSSRGVGTYKLPPKWFCIALANGPDDFGEAVRGMSNTSLNRCAGINILSDFNYWKAWAADPSQGNLHPGIIAFLTANPAYAYMAPPEDSEYPAEMFPSFRSWQIASDALKLKEKYDNNGQPLANQDEASLAVGMGIGERASHDFGAFYIHNTSLVKADDIFSGNASTKLPNKQVMYLSGQYLVNAVFQLLKEHIGEYNEKGAFSKGVVTKVKNAVKWLMDIGNVDFCSCIMRDIVTCIPPFADIVIDENFKFPGSDEFINRYTNLLKAKK